MYVCFVLSDLIPSAFSICAFLFPFCASYLFFRLTRQCRFASTNSRSNVHRVREHLFVAFIAEAATKKKQRKKKSPTSTKRIQQKCYERNTNKMYEEKKKTGKEKAKKIILNQNESRRYIFSLIFALLSTLFISNILCDRLKLKREIIDRLSACMNELCM